MKISVVINTYNAEEHLEEVLRSVKQFDEIVVCDMESTDSTLDIARRYGCRIVTFPRGEHRIVEPARQFAIDAASSEWVLVVDADEVVSEGLRDYLYRRITESDCPRALYVPRQNLFMGKPLRLSYPDYQLRFLHREDATWPPTIHSQPKVNGRVGRVPKRGHRCLLWHLDDQDIHHIMEKQNRYSDYEAVRKADRHFGLGALLLRPTLKFLQNYFVKGSILDGRKGFIKSVMNAYYQFIVVVKMMERRERK